LDWQYSKNPQLLYRKEKTMVLFLAHTLATKRLHPGIGKLANVLGITLTTVSRLTTIHSIRNLARLTQLSKLTNTDTTFAMVLGVKVLAHVFGIAFAEIDI
jgi:hypothetical protein